MQLAAAPYTVAVTWPMVLALASVLLLALETRLRKSFAPLTDLNGVGEKLDRSEKQFIAAQATAARALELAQRNGERIEMQRTWSQTLDRLAATQEETSKHLAAVAAVVEQLSRSMDRLDARLDRLP